MREIRTDYYKELAQQNQGQHHEPKIDFSGINQDQIIEYNEILKDITEQIQEHIIDKLDHIFHTFALQGKTEVTIKRADGYKINLIYSVNQPSLVLRTTPTYSKFIYLDDMKKIEQFLYQNFKNVKLYNFNFQIFKLKRDDGEDDISDGVIDFSFNLFNALNDKNIVTDAVKECISCKSIKTEHDAITFKF